MRRGLYYDSLGAITEEFGGRLPETASILIAGDPGSGKSTLAQQIVYSDLTRGRSAIFLCYETFPSVIIDRMKKFGMQVDPWISMGKFAFLDYYSTIAGQGEDKSIQPFDLTNVSIHLSSVMENVGHTATVVIDSLMPIFNEVDSKMVISFLETVSAKIRRSWGRLVMTITEGTVPSESLRRLETLADGVVELRLVEEGRRLKRYLLVKKMESRSLRMRRVPFEIKEGRGIILKKQRAPWLTDFLAKHD